MSDFELAWGRILELSGVVTSDLDRFCAQYGLTTSRTHVLWTLHQLGEQTHRSLADAIGVSAQNVTGLVDALERTGFLTRERHPTDRRASLITLSEHGRRTTQKMERDQRELTDRLFGQMSTHQFNGLLHGLETVLAKLKDLSATDTSPDRRDVVEVRTPEAAP